VIANVATTFPRPPNSVAADHDPEEMRQGIARLKKRLDEVKAFDPASVTEQNNIPHVGVLSAAVDEALIRTFGADTLDYKRYSDAAYFEPAEDRPCDAA